LILDRSQTLQNENIYTFLKDDLQYGGSLTYAQLQADVERLAAYLLTMAKPGDRVLLLYPSGIEYITAFFACLTAGLIAVPVYAVQSPKDHNRLNTIARDSGARLACTTRALYASTSAWREQLGSETLQVVCTDDIQESGNFALCDAAVSWDDVAF